MTAKSRRPEKIAKVTVDDGDPTTPDTFVIAGAEGMSEGDLFTLVQRLQATISGLNEGMSTITVGLTELLGTEGHHRVMEQAMAENVEAWSQVARALAPGQYSLPEDKAAALQQIRELVARGDYGSINTIPFVAPNPPASTVGAF